MADILNFPERDRIEQEAAEWLVKLDNGPLSDEEAAQLSLWLERSGEHRRTIVELCSLWDDMDIMSELSELFPLAGKTESGKARARRPFSPILGASLAAAATVILVVVFVFQQQAGFGLDRQAGITGAENVYQTSVGEQREIALADGSVVKLNTDSLVSTDYSDERRELHLIRGEAHFMVAHDRSRPFLVHAGGGVVRAVGTAFSVRLKGADVEVTVTEGRVEIASAIDTDGMLAATMDDSIPGKYVTTLDAGQTVNYDDSEIHSVNTINPEIISRKLSWQHGMLVFKGETLEQVVAEISRYTDTSIVISDPDLRDIRIGGYFKTGEVEALLTVLKDNFSVSVNRINDNLVYLSGERIMQADKNN